MNYYEQIKEELINNEIYKKIKDYSKNRNDLSTYYNVGKLLIEAQGGEKRAKYGDNLIKKYSERLKKELDKKYSFTVLKNMRQFYLMFIKGPTVSGKLTWSHYVELLKLNDLIEINYYIKIADEQNLAVRELRDRIKLKEYERLDEDTKHKFINQEKNKIEDFIKNPIIIKNNKIHEKISEKALKLLILEDIPNFLLELGDGFSFIKDEYKIKLGDRYNYIDLLLFNYKYNCFTVVELKVTELRKEHIGQIQTYMNYIDRNLRNINQDKTIGIIICKKDNKYIMEYCSDSRIFETTYILK